MGTLWLAGVAAVALAAVHVGAAWFRFLDTVPRSRWLSLAGGVSVAYVFVHLLPELGEAQETLHESAEGLLPALEEHAYVVALVGLAGFYGLERGSRSSRKERRSVHGDDVTSPRVAWLAIGFYAAYNALIGYLLVDRADRASTALAVFVVAMGVHFVVNDHGLRQHHRHVYHRWGRWLCGGGVLVGWAVGAATDVPEEALALLLAFLAGGVVLNVLKEELPEERESRFGAFVAGAAGYTALLLAL